MDYKSVEELDKMSVEELQEYMEDVEDYITGGWTHEEDIIYVEQMNTDQLTNYVGMFEHAAYVGNVLLKRVKEME